MIPATSAELLVAIRSGDVPKTDGLLAKLAGIDPEQLEAWSPHPRRRGGALGQ